jgi:hypothetical protein
MAYARNPEEYYRLTRMEAAYIRSFYLGQTREHQPHNRSHTMANKILSRPGSKTAAYEALARRPQGITGNELMAATGWPTGGHRWRVEVLGERFGQKVCWLDKAGAAELGISWGKRSAREIAWCLTDEPVETTSRKAA